MTNILKINPADNVVVAIQPQSAGAVIEVDGKQITVLEDVPAGHKIAICDLAEGENVIKYGFPIGHAREAPKEVVLNIPDEKRTFMGYRRKDGQVGIRNEVWIIPTVGCVNGIIQKCAERLRQETGAENIFAFTHNYGCSQLGDDHENTKKILRDMIHHPNAGAILVVSLGCENNQPDVFKQFCGEIDEDRVKFVTTQKIQGDEVEYCMPILRDLYAKTQQDERVAVPLSELRVGLKCGGSDGFSGITANPLLGCLSDWLVAQGGTTVLTEVPEMFARTRCDGIR